LGTAPADSLKLCCCSLSEKHRYFWTQQTQPTNNLRGNTV